MIDAREPLCDLNNIASPVQGIRACFDLMAYDTADDWDVACRRMEAVPAAIEGLRVSYEEGRDLGLVAARRQAVEAAHQAARVGGRRGSRTVLRRAWSPGRPACPAWARPSWAGCGGGGRGHRRLPRAVRLPP